MSGLINPSFFSESWDTYYCFRLLLHIFKELYPLLVFNFVTSVERGRKSTPFFIPCNFFAIFFFRTFISAFLFLKRGAKIQLIFIRATPSEIFFNLF